MLIFLPTKWYQSQVACVVLKNGYYCKIRMVSLNGSNSSLWKDKMEDLLYVKGRYHHPMFVGRKPADKDEEWVLLHMQV